ncbi:hypothetical protein, partial [uncultured Alistipes sp.]|uniref:hypothetical protein n=1 Tax=uncultured Alistipes sp. TaxID=538949 RepID=UPI00260D20DA
VTVFEAPAARALRRGSRGGAMECGGEQRGVTGGSARLFLFLFPFLFSFPNILCELRLFEFCGLSGAEIMAESFAGKICGFYKAARAAASGGGGPQLADASCGHSAGCCPTLQAMGQAVTQAATRRRKPPGPKVAARLYRLFSALRLLRGPQPRSKM